MSRRNHPGNRHMRTWLYIIPHDAFVDLTPVVVILMSETLKHKRTCLLLGSRCLLCKNPVSHVNQCASHQFTAVVWYVANRALAMVMPMWQAWSSVCLLTNRGSLNHWEHKHKHKRTWVYIVLHDAFVDLTPVPVTLSTETQKVTNIHSRVCRELKFV